MLGRNLLILFALSAFACGQQGQAANAQSDKSNTVKRSKTATAAKAKKRLHRSGSQHIAHKLIPPPPAYMPSILPELYYRQNVSHEEEEEEVALAAPDEKPKLIYVRNYSWGDSPRVRSVHNGAVSSLH